MAKREDKAKRMSIRKDIGKSKIFFIEKEYRRANKNNDSTKAPQNIRHEKEELSPIFRMVVKFITNSVIGLLIIGGTFFIILIIRNIPLSNSEYIGTVNGQIISHCSHLARSPSLGGGRGGIRTSKQCRVQLNSNQIISVNVSWGSARKGIVIRLYKYKQKTLFGYKYQYSTIRRSSSR